MNFNELVQSFVNRSTEEEVQSVFEEISRADLFRRFKIGSQTFRQEILHYRGRSHLAEEKSMATAQISLPLPVLPAGWTAEKDFKALGTLSPPNQRNIEPVGPHFLAHARRVSLSSSCLSSFRMFVSTQTVLSWKGSHQRISGFPFYVQGSHLNLETTSPHLLGR